jgi:hypothetical protein
MLCECLGVFHCNRMKLKPLRRLFSSKHRFISVLLFSQLSNCSWLIFPHHRFF